MLVDMNESAVTQEQRLFSAREEVANAITHFIGFGLSVAGLVLLVVFAVKRRDGVDDVRQIVSAALFGSSMIILYLSSTLYHSIWNLRAKRFLRKLDHAAIFVLIAGTYTPYLLVSLRGALGWTFFGIIWGIALLGIIMKFTMGVGSGKITTVPYVVMGWMCLFVMKPLIDAVSVEGIVWLAIGGACYTLGVIPYTWKRLPYNHAIWHLFTVAGTIFHFFAVLMFVTT